MKSILFPSGVVALLVFGGCSTAPGTQQSEGTGGQGGLASGTGGGSGVGGATSSGGMIGAGGATAGTGGSAAGTGGATAGTGGTTAGTGGTTAGTGGKTGTGGVTAGTGGATGTTQIQCGLPAVGTSGAAKPSGTAGNLKVINWAGFKGAVSYTFDDANQTQIDNYPALNALGVHMTFYLITGKNTMSNAVWPQAVKDGHELGNHTQSHAQTGTAADIDAATAYIKQHFGVTPYTMAAPYGDASYEPLAKTRFFVNRGVANNLVKPNDTTDPWNLPCYIPPTAALASAFNSQIDTAESGGGWRIVLVHGFGTSDGSYQPVDIAEFTASVTHAKSFGDMWIDSVADVGAYWVGQKLLSSTTASASASGSTWTWTLPSNFPPGKCLRVTVDGGTLKQGGNTLAWDSHGYYEISLDAGSLTLSP